MSDRYDSTEFAEIKYFNTTGTYGNADNGVRKSYYGISSTPHLFWQGTLGMLGAGTDVVDGHVYDPIVQAGLTEATPFELSVTDVDFTGTPGATITLRLDDDVADVSQHFIRAFIVEDNLLHSGEDTDGVNRDMITQTAVNITQAGEEQVLNLSFTVGGDWNVDNLRIIAIVQRDTDKLILQGATSVAAQPFSFGYYVLGDRVVVDSGQYQFGDVAVLNNGQRDNTYDLTVDDSGLPAGWSAWVTDGVDTGISLTTDIPVGGSGIFNVVIDAANTGYGTVSLTLHSQNGGVGDRTVTFSIITDDNDILIVDNDAGETYETDYFLPALDGYPRTAAVWDRTSGAPAAEILAYFDAVIWQCGTSYSGTFSPEDREAITDYLSGGGSIFVSGQDIGYEMNELGGAAYLWYRNTLHATFINDDTNLYSLTGVAGDPITDGLAVSITGGDGANNATYPSDIDPYNGGETIFTYSATQNAAVRYDGGDSRVVYFAFGFEGINSAADRTQVMTRIMDWLIPDLTGVEDTPRVPFTLSQNMPNPFNPTTKIGFSLESAGDVKLSVFDTRGRLVAVLEDGPRDAGRHEVSWNGRNAAGDAVSSGLYFYRLDAAGETGTKKMMLIK